MIEKIAKVGRGRDWGHRSPEVVREGLEAEAAAAEPVEAADGDHEEAGGRVSLRPHRQESRKRTQGSCHFFETMKYNLSSPNKPFFLDQDFKTFTENETQCLLSGNSRSQCSQNNGHAELSIEVFSQAGNRTNTMKPKDSKLRGANHLNSASIIMREAHQVFSYSSFRLMVNIANRLIPKLPFLSGLRHST